MNIEALPQPVFDELYMPAVTSSPLRVEGHVVELEDSAIIFSVKVFKQGDMVAESLMRLLVTTGHKSIAPSERRISTPAIQPTINRRTIRSYSLMKPLPTLMFS
jgi:hypothetical protein